MDNIKKGVNVWINSIRDKVSFKVRKRGKINKTIQNGKWVKKD